MAYKIENGVKFSCDIKQVNDRGTVIQQEHGELLTQINGRVLEIKGFYCGRGMRRDTRNQIAADLMKQAIKFSIENNYDLQARASRNQGFYSKCGMRPTGNLTRLPNGVTTHILGLTNEAKSGWAAKFKKI